MTTAYRPRACTGRGFILPDILRDEFKEKMAPFNLTEKIGGYTWYDPDGILKSNPDYFLVSEGANYKQAVLTDLKHPEFEDDLRVSDNLLAFVEWTESSISLSQQAAPEPNWTAGQQQKTYFCDFKACEKSRSSGFEGWSSHSHKSDHIFGHYRNTPKMNRGPGSVHNPLAQKHSARICRYCGKNLTTNHVKDHEDHCSENPSRVSRPVGTKRTCPHCKKEYRSDSFARHVRRCSVKTGKRPH